MEWGNKPFPSLGLVIIKKYDQQQNFINELSLSKGKRISNYLGQIASVWVQRLAIRSCNPVS
jgi:hypothetical protein